MTAASEASRCDVCDKRSESLRRNWRLRGATAIRPTNRQRCKLARPPRHRNSSDELPYDELPYDELHTSPSTHSCTFRNFVYS